MALLEVTAGVTSIFVLREVLRYQRHRRYLERIPFRIHVNGTRGKSSVTRLIGSALRASPRYRVVAKTTGTEPRFIFPDGTEWPIFRPGRPNILEQTKIVKRAAELGANVLVVECMGITPEYIRVLEDMLIRSTHGVITNVREDHLDTMGPTLEDVARNLALTLPRGGIAWTAETRYFDLLQKEARKRQTELRLVQPEEWVTDQDLEGFSYLEHAENVALALAVAQEFGVEREEALREMYRATPDPGVMRVWRLHVTDKEVLLYNALAANDPQSTLQIWEQVRRRHPNHTLILLVVMRPDRPQRTDAFRRILGQPMQADVYILTGKPTRPLLHRLLQLHVPQTAIQNLEDAPAEDVVQACITCGGSKTVILAVGNIVRYGERIIEVFKQFAEVDEVS